MRRTGAGSTGTERTEAGSGGRASRGMSAVTPPASTNASWVEKSSTRCSTRGFVSAPTNRRWNQSWQAVPGGDVTHVDPTRSRPVSERRCASG